MSRAVTPRTEVVEIDIEGELDVIASRYKDASGIIITVLNGLGVQADGLLKLLPEAVHDNLHSATETALNHAMTAAHSSRKVVGDQPNWLNSSISAAMGAAGGFGGLPTALAELPVTTTLLLRVIQGVAEEHGFDVTSESVRFDCVQVFAAGGPMAQDDSADIAFLSTRLGLQGKAMQGVVALVAPRLAAVLGQKLAAQAVPVLGAMAGAATNYAYTSYYREMAHIQFGLRKLALDANQPHEDLIDGLRTRLEVLPVKRA